MKKTKKKAATNDVRDLRVSRGWTQAQLADALGVSVTTISFWETGRSNPSRMAAKLLDGLREKKA